MKLPALQSIFLAVTHRDRQQQGMTLLEVVFALAIFVIFGTVFFAVSSQLNVYLTPDRRSYILTNKAESPVPILLAERLSTAMDGLLSVLEQPGADISKLSKECQKIDESNLIELLGSKNKDVSFEEILLDNVADENEFNLGSRYQFCLYEYDQQAPKDQSLYVLVAKPSEKNFVMLPVVRRIFCRPKPFCAPTS